MAVFSLICLVSGSTLAWMAAQQPPKRAICEGAGGSLIVLGLVSIGSGLPLMFGS